MSSPDSFIEEVTEEVRRDRLFALFRKYGWIAGVLVLLVVGGTAWTQWQQAQRAAEARSFGDTLAQALDQPEAAARVAALQAVEAEGADQAAIRDLIVASDPETMRDAALEALARVEASQDVTQYFRDLATLRRVVLAGAELDVAARRAALDPLAVPGRVFRPLVLEQLAYLEVEAGNIDAALEQLRIVSNDQQSPPGLRERAGQMIVALGGAPTEG
ncbi:MAG: hypothetical protein ACK5M4_08560 [Pseudorhodobacter sp.]